MEKRDILIKISKFRTSKERIDFLNKVSKGKGMKPETRKYVYEVLGDAYFTEGNVDDANDCYKKIGLDKEFIKKGDELVEKGKLWDATELYEKGGALDKISKIGDMLVKRGWLSGAYEAYKIAKDKVKAELTYKKLKEMPAAA